MKIFVHGNKKDTGYVFISVIILMFVFFVCSVSALEYYRILEKHKLKNNLINQKQYLEIKWREKNASQ